MLKIQSSCRAKNLKFTRKVAALCLRSAATQYCLRPVGVIVVQLTEPSRGVWEPWDRPRRRFVCSCVTTVIRGLFDCMELEFGIYSDKLMSHIFYFFFPFHCH